jgi:Fe-S oxidoreductase
VPHSLGGTDGPENLVLLCSRCHRAAPNVSDPSFMWVWLRRYAVTLYDTDWIERGYEEFERIFKRQPFANLNGRISDDKIRDVLKKRFKMITVHFGEGRPNPATVAWMFAELEKDLGLQSAAPA